MGIFGKRLCVYSLMGLRSGNMQTSSDDLYDQLSIFASHRRWTQSGFLSVLPIKQPSWLFSPVIMGGTIKNLVHF